MSRSRLVVCFGFIVLLTWWLILEVHALGTGIGAFYFNLGLTLYAFLISIYLIYDLLHFPPVFHPLSFGLLILYLIAFGFEHLCLNFLCLSVRELFGILGLIALMPTSKHKHSIWLILFISVLIIWPLLYFPSIKSILGQSYLNLAYLLALFITSLSLTNYYVGLIKNTKFVSGGVTLVRKIEFFVPTSLN